MKADYLVLGDGTEVRVEFNMNALANITALTGKGLADLLSATTDMLLLRTIAWCCVVEGESIEGREYKISEIEFGRLMTMRSIGKFSEIFTQQIVRDTQKKKRTEGQVAESAHQVELTEDELLQFTEKQMRRFAFGKLNYTPEQYGRMMVGDFLDAMAGYNEARVERTKDIAGIIRKATTILWNIQVPVEDRLEPADLWPFEWEKRAEEKEISAEDKEEKQRLQKAQEDFLTNK